MPAPSSQSRHIFVNGLSVGTGGGYTVAREVLRHLALARPTWSFTMGVISDHPLQKEFAQESLPANADLSWAPSETLHRGRRLAYEKRVLKPWIEQRGSRAVVQLNGMLIHGLKVPALAHFQDPFPFRPEAWNGLKDRVVSALKRREHRYAIRHAAVCGWTSNYLRDLIVGHAGVQPKRSIVFYNGVPDDWILRSEGQLPEWDSRPMELVTVSNVSPYKRQSLVIKVLPRLRQIAGLEHLQYRILGAVKDSYKQELVRLAKGLGVGDVVHIEGRVSDERVQQALYQARALPLMSVCESFGIPPIEAMTFGTPVVIADCCALPEVCGDAALRVPMDDEDRLFDTLRNLLTDPTLARELQTRGAERVKAFQWGHIGKLMADSLEEISSST